VSVTLAAVLSCRREAPAPPLPEVTLFATLGDPAVAVVTAALERQRVARLRRVAAAADAELLWLGDPAQAVDVGALVAAEVLPGPEGVGERFGDPQRRFVPLCARATLLVRAPAASLPFEPVSVRDLADPRLAGRVAVPPFTKRPMALALAALSMTYGERSLRRFLDLLARNRPRLARDEGEVRALVARGAVDLGLVGSEEAAAGAVSAAGLEVIVPDQSGRGAVVLPTALALGRKASAVARATAVAFAGPEVERLLVARVPGFMPIRPEVPVPVGVRPASNLVALPLDWDRLAAEEHRLESTLRAWPSVLRGTTPQSR